MGSKFFLKGWGVKKMKYFVGSFGSLFLCNPEKNPCASEACFRRLVG
jgi:hypothetical protein